MLIYHLLDWPKVNLEKLMMDHLTQQYSCSTFLFNENTRKLAHWNFQKIGIISFRYICNIHICKSFTYVLLLFYGLLNLTGHNTYYNYLGNSSVLSIYN